MYDGWCILGVDSLEDRGVGVVCMAVLDAYQQAGGVNRGVAFLQTLCISHHCTFNPYNTNMK